MIPKSEFTHDLRIHGHKGDIFHGRAYFFGGFYYPDSFQSRIMTNDLFCIDLKTKVWGKLQSTIPDRHPPARKYHACAVVYNKFIVSGGKRKGKLILNDLWQFNLSTVHLFTGKHQWTQLDIETPKNPEEANSILMLHGHSMITVPKLPQHEKLSNTVQQANQVLCVRWGR